MEVERKKQQGHVLEKQPSKCRGWHIHRDYIRSYVETDMWDILILSLTGRLAEDWGKNEEFCFRNVKCEVPTRLSGQMPGKGLELRVTKTRDTD